MKQLTVILALLATSACHVTTAQWSALAALGGGDHSQATSTGCYGAEPVCIVGEPVCACDQHGQGCRFACGGN
jgi:hypothetical protein